MNLDIGGIIAGALGGGAEAGGQVAQGYIDNNRKQELQQHLNDMEVQKSAQINQANANLARDTAAQERARVVAVAGGSTGYAAADKFAAGGDIANATAYSNLQSSGESNVKPYETRIDRKGGIIFDNGGSELKKNLDQQTADAKTRTAEARMVAAQGRGQPKPLTQDDLDKVAEQSSKIIKDGGYEKFGAPDLSGKPTPDQPYNAALKSLVSRALTQARQQGIPVPPDAVATSVKGRLDAMGTDAQAQATAAATELFKDDKVLSGPVLANARKQFGAATPADLPGFTQYVRDMRFRKAVSDLSDGAAPPAAPGATPTQPAATAPTTAPAKPAVATPVDAPPGAQSIDKAAADSVQGKDKFQGMSDISLSNMANSPRFLPMTRKQAQNEINRRKQTAWREMADSRATNTPISDGD